MGCKSGSTGGLLGKVIVTVSGLNWTDLTTADSRLLFELEGLDSCLILDFILGRVTTEAAAVAGSTVEGVGLVVTTCIVGVRGSGGGGGGSGMTPTGVPPAPFLLRTKSG